MQFSKQRTLPLWHVDLSSRVALPYLGSCTIYSQEPTFILGKTPAEELYSEPLAAQPNIHLQLFWHPDLLKFYARFHWVVVFQDCNLSMARTPYCQKRFNPGICFSAMDCLKLPYLFIRLLLRLTISSKKAIENIPVWSCHERIHCISSYCIIFSVHTCFKSKFQILFLVRVKYWHCMISYCIIFSTVDQFKFLFLVRVSLLKEVPCHPL